MESTDSDDICPKQIISPVSKIFRRIHRNYLNPINDKINSPAFGGSNDKERGEISVDAEKSTLNIFISSPYRNHLDTILVNEELSVSDFKFAILTAGKIISMDPSQFGIQKPLRIEHTPLPNRCSHSDIAFSIKPGDVLSRSKWKRFRKDLINLVEDLI